jgi:uncharacterized peroxidase-related enzyme
MRGVSRFPIVQRLLDLPPDLASRLQAVQDKAGFVPNIFLALGHRPAQLRHFMDSHDEIMAERGSLTKVDKELIVVATSGTNQCLYCVVAHGALLRIYSKQRTLADAVALDHRKAGLGKRQTVMLDYACKLARTPEVVVEEDVQRLRDAQFSEEDVWDIASVTAFFAMSNRMAAAMELQPNEQFYTMGRVDRKT